MRRPRFEHLPDSVPAVELTERDREILRSVERHRFLRSDQIATLVGGSPQQILRRLHLLYHHGYLERPRCQIDYYHEGGGSRPMVYGLGTRGFAVLRPSEEVVSNHADRSFKNAAVKRLFLEHALLISDVMVAVEIACRERGGIRLLLEEELLTERQQRCRVHSLSTSPPVRFSWGVELGGHTRIGVVPDRVFALEHPDSSGSARERVYFFLEADRSTMPIARQSLSQSSFYRKLLAYEATWVRNLHRLRFGFHRFRVLTVTTSSERLKHLVETSAQLERGHGLFLFSDVGSLHEQMDLFSLPWRTPRQGEHAFLLN